MKKLNKAINIFFKYADNITDHVKQIRDPRQMHFNFINKDDVTLETQNIMDLPIEKLEWLKKYMHAGGRMYGIFDTCIYYKNHGGGGYYEKTSIITANFKNKIIGAAILENDGVLNIYVDPVYRQEGIGKMIVNKIKETHKPKDLIYGFSPLSPFFYPPAMEGQSFKKNVKKFDKLKDREEEEEARVEKRRERINYDAQKNIDAPQLFPQTKDDKYIDKITSNKGYDFDEPIPDKFLNLAKNKLNWEKISYQPWLTDNQIEKYENYIYWHSIVDRPNLSKEFILKYRNKFDNFDIKILKKKYPQYNL